MKEISAILNGKNINLNFKELGKEICEGCEKEIALLEVPLIGGENKGKLINVRKGCICEDKQLAQEALEARERAKKRHALELFNTKSLINEELKQASLGNYSPRNESHEIALNWAYSYCKGFGKRENKKAILAGSYGLGKSHLAVGITKILMKNGFTCIFTSVPKLFTRIKSTWDKGSDTREIELLEALEMVDLLVLDDLGAEGASDWQVTKLFEVVDSREGKHTIFTTNHSSEGLMSQIGKRNYDRLFYKCDEVVFQGESYRLLNKKRGGQSV